MKKRKRYHFIGIGGIGMGSLASLVLEQGHRVSGSDVKENILLNVLKEQGAKITIGHAADNIQGVDVVIYSSAVKADNPELALAKQKGIPTLRRGELLAELMKNHETITVAGAHGKTTTSSMICHMLSKADFKPTTAVGGVVMGEEYHAVLGAGKYFVAELDESDGTFLCAHPKYSVITNIDFEHLDYYQNWNNILKAYTKFIEQTRPEGEIFACGDDQRLNKLLYESKRKYTTYGFSSGCDVTAKNIRSQGCTTKFDCIYKGKDIGTIQLIVPGQHNMLNALACVALGLALSIDFSLIEESLLSYQGVQRRFQIKGRVDDITVVDDYGHHPTEISATLQAANSLNKNRVITVFQPHRYSRTKLLMEQFVESLSVCDYLIITDIYSASEQALDGISARKLCDRLKESGRNSVVYLKKEDIVNHLLKIIKFGDLVLTLGAGDIHRIAEEFVHVLNDRKT